MKNRWLLTILVLLIALFSSWKHLVPLLPEEPGGHDQANGQLMQAHAAHRSGVWVVVNGRVKRVLADDLDGNRHQRFILQVGEGLTVLVSHNIDLAPRVSVRPGDRVVLRGRYEWNAKGGVVHWTHHDPRGRVSGGWIEVGGKRVR
jgi:hypothetical protein